MKQHEFIWVMKQYPTDKTYMMDNGQTVVLIKDLMFIHQEGELIIRFTEYNENYIIPDRKELDHLMDITKHSTNFQNKVYTYCKEHFQKQ